jgi:amino acid transporter
VVAPPYIALFITPLVHDPITQILIHLGWILWMLNWAPGLALVCQRYVFAFSFDRLLPTKLADVNPRFHVPLATWAVNFVVASILLIVTVFSGILGVLLNSVAIWSIVWLLASLVAIRMPFSRFKDVVKGLPGANWKVPLLSIIGAISAVMMALSFYWSITTPAIGPSTPMTALGMASIYIAAIVIYAISYYYNKKRGIDLRRVYSEIPPI